MTAELKSSVTDDNLEARMAALMNMKESMENGDDTEGKDLKDFQEAGKAEKLEREASSGDDMMAKIREKQERLRKENAVKKAEKDAKKKAYEERKAARRAASQSPVKQR